MNHGGNLEGLLREVVHELAAEARPVDLSAPALRAAHRVRVRRAVSAAAAVLVVIGGLAFAVNRGTGADRSIPPAERSPTATSTPTATVEPTQESALPGESPVLLPGGWLIRTAPAAGGGMLVYEDGRGRYRLVTYAGVVSPNGRFVARSAPEGLVVRTYEDDREVYRASARENVRPVWSPDSSRIAFVMLTAEGTKVRTGRVDDGTETTSGAVRCEDGCVLKWLDGGQRLRVYAGSYRAEVSAAGGPVAAPSAVPDDPCGRQVLAYPIDTTTWLCVTTSGFAVTTGAGVVRERVPFPTTLGGVGVQPGNTGYDLFRPK